VREEPLKAGEVVRAILRAKCTGEDVGKNVLLAGACLEDVGATGLGRAVAEEVTTALLAAAHDRALPPPVQRDAGFALGCTGWRPPDLDEFVPIPAGLFLYGDEKRTVVIEQPFAIARYPVTNVQYRRFVEAGGYDRREWWSDLGWAWRSGKYDSKDQEDYEERHLARRPPEKRNEPFYWHDAKWNNPLTPVVGVSWFEAEAYANWLAQELGRSVRLPTEEEWERAARHTDGREYPWGNAFDHHCLNCAEFWAGRKELSDSEWLEWFRSGSYRLTSTTTVGQFPDGDSEAGTSDMCGNVWEWTCSWYDAEGVYRVVRGGSWYRHRRYARCASRIGLVPDDFRGIVGLRVVSPGSIPAF